MKKRDILTLEVTRARDGSLLTELVWTVSTNRTIVAKVEEDGVDDVLTREDTGLMRDEFLQGDYVRALQKREAVRSFGS